MSIRRRCTSVVGVLFLIVYFIFLLLQIIWVETNVEIWQQEPMSVDADSLGKPMLGIVLLLVAEEIVSAVESLQRWPTKCSAITLNRIDLIFYFAGKIPLGIERQVADASVPISCFKTMKVVSAALHLEEKISKDLRSEQFYKLFLAPDVRAHFIEYDALAILDWDLIISQENSFERLYYAAFTTTEPFWIKGSRHTLVYSDNRATNRMWTPVNHIDGNAIYNNTDKDFLDFIHYSLDRWQFTRPYDVALWETLLDHQYNSPLWQRYVSRFLEFPMVSTVGSQKRQGGVVTSGNSPNVLFLRRVAGTMDTPIQMVTPHSYECQYTCGYRGTPVEENVVSRVCDATCMNYHPWMPDHLNGHNGGSGNMKYGKSCRLCYTNQQAVLDAEQALNGSNGNSWTPYGHAITCDKKQPPEATSCSLDCKDNANTICDYRCGTGWNIDWHCNWRSLGEKCRFCFNDIMAALRADKIAQKAGGRVIMCETHAFPPEVQDMARRTGIHSLIQNGVEQGFVESSFLDDTFSNEVSTISPKEKEFLGGIKHGNICIFIPGYFEFFHETRLAVDSIYSFMPGVRVVIATHPMDYHVFYRTLSEPYTAVSVVNNTRVAFASLTADVACGNETTLIYYMLPGEVLSRPFKARDTHSLKGDLLVKYTDTKLAGGEFARRSVGTSILLGFHGLSFTYDSDLILPVEINRQLRALLLVTLDESGSTENGKQENFGTYALGDFLDSVSRIHREYASIFIPELLAALLFMRNTQGVKFYNPWDWRNHIYEGTTIREILPVKPRFGCSIDISPAIGGYDVARQLDKHLQAFYNGAQCDLGFIEVNPATLELKKEWEFPTGYPIHNMPSLKDYNISVIYRTFSGDSDLFDISLPTAIKHIPDALEIVIVVEEEDKVPFEKLLAPHRESAPFPLRLVTETSIMDGHIQQKYSKMRADLYTKGDYIIHLDSDVIVLREVTYEDIFHLGKPVLPFRRYRDDTPDGEPRFELISRLKYLG